MDCSDQCMGQTQRSLCTRSGHSNRMMKPNRITYSALLDVYARHAGHCAPKAEQLLHWLEQQEDEALKPDSVVYLTVTTAWMRGNEPDRAQRVVDRLWQIYLLENHQEDKQERRGNFNTFQSSSSSRQSGAKHTSNCMELSAVVSAWLECTRRLGFSNRLQLQQHHHYQNQQQQRQR